MLNTTIAQYLSSNGVKEINPVWDSWMKQKIVGYHYEVGDKHKLWTMEPKLKVMFIKNDLPYSLSEINHNSDSTKFILFLNN